MVVDDAVENRLDLWTEYLVLWTSLWMRKNFEKTLGKPLRTRLLVA